MFPVTQDRRNGTDDGDLDAIENPGDTKREQDEQMKAAPWQAIEAGWNVGGHLVGFARCFADELSIPVLQGLSGDRHFFSNDDAAAKRATLAHAGRQPARNF